MKIRFRDLSGKRLWQLAWPFLLSVTAGLILNRYHRGAWWAFPVILKYPLSIPFVSCGDARRKTNPELDPAWLGS